MFDIGFGELVVIAVVGLLVIGPERLPGAIRTGSAWLARIRRAFNELKLEVEQELHNDAVMQELKKTRREVGHDLIDDALMQELKKAREAAGQVIAPPGDSPRGDADGDAGKKPE